MRRFVVRIENYVPLIRALSEKHWQQLLPQTKVWVDRSDFFQEGMTFTRFDLMPQYNPLRGTKFSTYLFLSLDRFYRAYRRSLTCEKRKMNDEAVIYLSEKNRHLEGYYTDGIDGMAVLERLYEAASVHLKCYMADWFFSSQGPSRVMKQSEGFRRARAEFLKVGKRFGVTAKLCETVLSAQRMGVFNPEYWDEKEIER